MQKLKLHWQILIAMSIGIVIGGLFQYSGTDLSQSNIYAAITALGTIFVRLLKMIIVPLIFTSIITGVSGIGDGKKLGNAIEFRTTLEISYQLKSNNRIGLSFGHISNANLGANNPGVEILSLSYQLAY